MSRVSNRSFDVLHLFTDFFQFSLDLNYSVADTGVVALRSHRIGFPIQFLKQEVTAFANFSLLLLGFLQVLQVRTKADDFFTDIETFCHQGYFLM